MVVLIEETPQYLTEVPSLLEADPLKSSSDAVILISESTYIDLLCSKDTEDIAEDAPINNDLPPEKVDVAKVNSSLKTILTLVSSMVGASILTIPWAMNQAGLVYGTVIVLLHLLVATGTAWFQISFLQTNPTIKELPDLIETMMGSKAAVMARWIAAFGFVGTGTVIHVLISTFALNTLNFAEYASTNYNASFFSFDEVICPINGSDPDLQESTQYFNVFNVQFIVISLMLGIIFKPYSTDRLANLMSYGSINVLVMVVVVTYLATAWGFNIQTESQLAINYKSLSKVGIIGGIIMQAFAIHSYIIKIMKSNRNQGNNTRDLFIAMTITTFVYLYIAIVFYLTFPMVKDCIDQVSSKNSLLYHF